MIRTARRIIGSATSTGKTRCSLAVETVRLNPLTFGKPRVNTSRIVAAVGVCFAADTGTSGGAGVAAVAQRALVFSAQGSHVYLPRGDRDYAITVGLRMLLLRRMVLEQDDLYQANAQELPMLRYYANSIAHLLA